MRSQYLVCAPDDLDLIILSDRDGAHAMLCSELLRKRSAHKLSPLIGGGCEMSLVQLVYQY